MNEDQDYSDHLYVNPPNADEIINTISEMKKHDEIHNLIIQTFPGWILYSTDTYSDDYLYLNNNWKKVCEMTKTTPKKIVLVDYINFHPDFALIRAFCNIMTTFGYCVRRKEEFGSCEKCGKAIPVEQVWKVMKSKDMPVPDKWSSKCSVCN